MKTYEQDGYTPGPWHLGRNGDDCARDHAICAGFTVLAKVYGRGYPISKGWSPGSAADARLMCKAPEMHAAISGLLSRLQTLGVSDAWPEIDAARAIVADLDETERVRP